MSARRRPLPAAVLVGATLVAAGVVVLLRELGPLSDVSLVAIALLAVGGALAAANLVSGRRGWVAPLILLAVGAVVLLRDLRAIPRDVSIWPIVVIAVGLALLLDARVGNRDDSAG
jgi:hypothetical protein